MAKKKRGPGRSSPNLKRTDEYIINQHGVKITHEEARQLRNIVARVNRKASKMEKQFEGHPLYFGGQQLQENREQLKLMGEEMDIMIRKRSAALQEFTSKKQFNAYLRNAQRAADVDYLDYRAKLYKKNLQEAIKKEFGMYPELTKGLDMRIRMMKPKDVIKLVGSNRAFQISYVYSAEGKLSQLMDMRSVFNLRSPYDDYDEEF